MLGDPFVERAEEINAAVRIVFPAVLAVEDNAHQRRPVAGIAAGCSADGLQLADEIVGRVLRLVALVVEADLVAHGVVAEDDLQALPLLFHAPGAIEHLGIAQEAVAVSRNPALGRAGKNFLVRGNPFNAGGRNGRNDLLADRAFRGPHAARLGAEHLLVKGHGQLDLRLGVFAVAFQMLG